MADSELPPMAANGNGTGLSEVEEQFKIWREDMPKIVRDLLHAELPGVFETALAKLVDGFVPRQELVEILEKQRHEADEKYALLSTVTKLQVENAELRGRLDSVEKTVRQNTSGIEALRRFTESTLGAIQSSVSSIQQSVGDSSRTLTQSLQTVIDRQNSGDKRHDTLEKRVATSEDALDKVRENVRSAEQINEDLRARVGETIPTLNDAIFGGRGQKGLVSLVETQAQTMQPILSYIEELKRRDEANRQRLEFAKTTFLTVIKNWKVWAFILPASAASATFVKFLEALFGGN